MMAGFGSSALNSIGMSVPGSESLAAAQTVPGETDEERKRRLALASQQNNPSVAGLSALSSVSGMAGVAGRYGRPLGGFGI
jgi:hypothetical protein